MFYMTFENDNYIRKRFKCLNFYNVLWLSLKEIRNKGCDFENMILLTLLAIILQKNRSFTHTVSNRHKQLKRSVNRSEVVGGCCRTWSRRQTSRRRGTSNKRTSSGLIFQHRVSPMQDQPGEKHQNYFAMKINDIFCLPFFTIFSSRKLYFKHL